MDASRQNLGFAANPSQNSFMNIDNILHLGAGAGADHSTALKLDSSGTSLPLFLSSRGMKRKRNLIDGSMGQNVGLCLGLGNYSSSSDSKGGSSATAWSTLSSAKENDEESSMELDLDFSLHLGNNENVSSTPKVFPSYSPAFMQPKIDLKLSLSTGPGASHESEISTMWTPQLVEGSISSSTHWKSESFLVNPSLQTVTVPFLNQAQDIPDLSESVVTKPKSSISCTSGISQQQLQQSNRLRSNNSSSTKTCQFNGCGKGARGASGLCIAHGGGRRCQKAGCQKGAEGRTVFCKAHGGGRRCEFLGCTKSAEGRTNFCIAHGGGRRCSHDGCTRAARGKSGLCIRHGGGKRCQKENCTKSAEGLSGLCISHGGGRRCQFMECGKGAQGSTMFCKAHGGGKRCSLEGCTRGAEGSTPFCKGHGGGKRCTHVQAGGTGVACPKSVHGGTLFCVAHGGGKRCAIPECTKSARGRTEFCVRHGGGKRCKSEGCGKSAQGSTDFCKAHGGGKRCCWGQIGSGYGEGDEGCVSFARNKAGLCASHGALVQDKRVHGGATLGSIMVQDSKQPPNNMNIWGKHPQQQGQAEASGSVLVPEGRVHGGRLMALLSSNSGS